MLEPGDWDAWLHGTPEQADELIGSPPLGALASAAEKPEEEGPLSAEQLQPSRARGGAQTLSIYPRAIPGAKEWRDKFAPEHRKSGAGDGDRTHILSLGSSGPAIERRPLCLSACRASFFRGRP